MTRLPLLAKLTGTAKLEPAGQLLGSVGSHTVLLNHWVGFRIICTGAMRSGKIVATLVRAVMLVVDVLPERMFSGFARLILHNRG